MKVRVDLPPPLSVTLYEIVKIFINSKMSVFKPYNILKADWLK